MDAGSSSDMVSRPEGLRFWPLARGKRASRRALQRADIQPVGRRPTSSPSRGARWRCAESSPGVVTKNMLAAATSLSTIARREPSLDARAIPSRREGRDDAAGQRAQRQSGRRTLVEHGRQAHRRRARVARERLDAVRSAHAPDAHSRLALRHFLGSRIRAQQRLPPGIARRELGDQVPGQPQRPLLGAVVVVERRLQLRLRRAPGWLGGAGLALPVRRRRPTRPGAGRSERVRRARAKTSGQRERCRSRMPRLLRSAWNRCARASMTAEGQRPG